MTRTKAHKLHRELWDWLYHHPSKKKSDWPGWKDNGGNASRVRADCFLCEYYYFHFGDCLHCPLFLNNYFTRWALCASLKTKKKYAKLVRDAVK